MALRQRPILMAAAAVCVVLVLTVLLVAGPPPETLRDGVMRFASLGRGPEEVAERAVADEDDGGGGGGGGGGDGKAGNDDGPAINDPTFYGDYPMFGSMMDYWLQGNLSRLAKEHRVGRRELKHNNDMLVDDVEGKGGRAG